MKKYLLSLITFFTPFINFAQEQNLSERVDSVFKDYTGWFVDFIFFEIPFSDSFQIPWVVLMLIGAGVFFTFYFKLINFTGFLTAIRVVSGKYEDIEKH